MPSGPATQHEDPFFPSKGKQPQKRRDRWQINNLAGLRCLGSRTQPTLHAQAANGSNLILLTVAKARLSTRCAGRLDAAAYRHWL